MPSPPDAQDASHAPAWHLLGAQEAASRLGVDPGRGLDTEMVGRRLGEHGPNRLEERPGKAPLRILWEQFTGTMVVVLLAAAVVSALLGDLLDTAAILAIVALNAALGFSQEYRAERAMTSLKRLSAPQATVRREGRLSMVPSAEVVPGDILILEAGALVAADVRLLESHALAAQESILTGESEPVRKAPAALEDPELPLGDRRNMAYMGTTVTSGRGAGVVVETGMQTELGHVAELVETVEAGQTPLQQRLDRLGRVLAVAALALVALIFVLGLLRGQGLELMFLTAVSIAVAAVPEGLPAVVTIALALGAQRMLARNALIRKLPAVETLGSVTVICSDKTGTLTENRMRAEVLRLPDRGGALTEVRLAHGEAASEPASEAITEATSEAASGVEWERVGLPMLVAALCNDAEPGAGGGAAIGDPTEVALAEAAAIYGIERDRLDGRLPRLEEAPFASERRRMATLHRVDGVEGAGTQPGEALARLGLATGSGLVLAKGAVESILEVSDRVLRAGETVPLDDAWRLHIQEAGAELAARGYRTLAFALRPVAEAARAVGEGAGAGDIEEALERDLVFLGVVGLMDPPRPEAAAAVATAVRAGVRPIMITGDHPRTAVSVAEALGLAAREDRVVTGRELESFGPADLRERLAEAQVFARVSPAHKLDIVTALQERGEVVAMTGDGVNDAPALRRADIGIAMGITGTDVSKEAADMVLVDDDFATIVAAIEEGRVIYDNIRKFLRFLLTANTGEIVVMVVALLAGLPLPLLPIQILWMNLVTDGLPALALAVEPAERAVMARPPRDPRSRLLDARMASGILSVGVFLGLATLALGWLFYARDDAAWQTMIFTTLTLAQLFLALGLRSEEASFFDRLGGNPALLGAVALTVALQLAVVYVPWLQPIFDTVPLSGAQLALVLAASTLGLWAAEVEKAVVRRTL